MRTTCRRPELRAAGHIFFGKRPTGVDERHAIELAASLLDALRVPRHPLLLARCCSPASGATSHARSAGKAPKGAVILLMLLSEGAGTMGRQSASMGEL
jgi:hypothetical protein